MNAKDAAWTWRTLRGRGLNVTARYLEAGLLAKEHVVEVEPRPSLATDDVRSLVELAEQRNLELSYGKSPRRVLVLS